jgi:acetoin utilization protein AcuB
MDTNAPVRDWMTTGMITIGPDDMIVDAFASMSMNYVRHLPVLADGELIGLISNRDLYRVIPPETQDHDRVIASLYGTKVRSVMAKPPLHTIQPSESIAEAARILVREKVSCLPVLDADQQLVGLITSDDLLGALTGEPQPN